MTALDLEAQGGAVAMGRRIDQMLLAVDALLTRVATLTVVAELTAEAVGSLLEPEDRERLYAALDALAVADEMVTRVHHAAERSRTHGQAALDAYIERKKAETAAEPWIPPQGTQRRPGSLPQHVTPVQIDKDTGKIWTQSPDRDDPLAGY